MNTSDVRKIITKSESADWFNSVNITVSYPSIKVTRELKGFASIFDFFLRQKNGWDRLENLNQQLQLSKNYFSSNFNTIEHFFTSYNSQPENIVNQHWRQIHSQLVQKNHSVFTFDSVYTEFFIDLQNNKPEFFQGAFQFVTTSNGVINNANNKVNLIGQLLAYEFELKDFTELTNRRDKEKRSINSLKTGLVKKANELENQLDEHLLDSNKKIEEFSLEVQNLKNTKEKQFDEWFNNSQNSFSDFDSISKQKIQNLEKTYNEVLKLKKPAEHWQKRASSLQVQGWVAFVFLCISLVGVSYFLGSILWKAPEEIYKSFFGTDKSSAIRWSIVYITLLSFIAYGIRAITKVMFSSFHLARDAQERHTLTYFYLSLLEDSKIDSEEKQLIMQSLFSRSDTGLLKEDSSPTMPNDVVSKLLGK